MLINKAFNIWFVVIVVISIFLTKFIPFQLDIFLLLTALVLLLGNRFSASKNVNSAIWLKFCIVAASIISAYSFKLVLQQTDFADGELFALLLVVQFLMLGFGALLIYNRRDKLLPATLFVRGLKYSLLLFGFVVSLLAFAIPSIVGPERLSATVRTFEAGGFWTDFGLRMLPVWFRGGSIVSTFNILALGAWSICFGGLIALFIDRTEENQPLQSRLEKPFAILIVVVCLANPGLTLKDYYLFKKLKCAEGDATQTDEYIGKFYHAWDGLSRQDMVSFELDLLKHTRKCLVKTDYKNVLAEVSARLILLEPKSNSHLLTFASSMFQINRKDSFTLFDPLRIDDDKLQNYKAETLEDALFLSQVWMYRNKIQTARDILQPFVKQIDLAGKLGDVEKAAVIDFAEYCLFTKQTEQALDLLLAYTKKNKADFRVLVTLGEIYYEQENLAKAFEYLNMAFQKNKYERRVIWNMVALYFLMGDTNAVVPYVKRIKLPFSPSQLIGKQKGKMYLPGESFLQQYLIPGRTRVRIVAKATSAKGEWPIMELWVNGKKWGQAEVKSEKGTGYAFEFEAVRGLNRITIKYTNDYGDKQEDRNLFILAGAIEPIFYEGKKR